MAITKSLLRFLLTQRDEYGLGNEGGRMLTLGVQDIHATHEDIANILKRGGIEPVPIDPANRKFTSSQVVSADSAFAHVKDLFHMLGFEDVQTLDFNAAENPDHVHDLNHPVTGDVCETGGGTIQF